MIMSNYLILLIFMPGLFLIFMFTKASLIEFIFGFGLCLISQTILIACYCAVKMQQALLDSTRIKLQQNYVLNVEKQYPFKQRKQNPKIFLNKYTEEEKLETKKNTLKVQSFQNYTSEDQILSEEPKKQMLKFLKQKSCQSNVYNFLSKTLIKLGKQLCQIGHQKQILALKTKHSFQTFQEGAVSEISQGELQNSERQLLDELDIKIQIRKDNHKNILLPSWNVLLQGLQNVGKQFAKINQMHRSNNQIIAMVNNKIIEDFEFIQSQIKKSLRSLEDIQKKSLQLKKQNEEFLSRERNVSEHQMDLIFLLKQHYYKFQDFQLRIKQNQKNYQFQVKQLSYFREKLRTFSRQNREKYEKIFKTRFFAILDSYNITIEESIKLLRKVLSTTHLPRDEKPPKVNKLEIYKNVDHQVEAERKYQEQYFDRANFYFRISEDILESMRDLRFFLLKLTGVFSEFCKNLENFQKTIANAPQYSKHFTTMLILKFIEIMKRLFRQFQHLTNLHSRFMQPNEEILLVSQNHIKSSIQQATQILNSLSDLHQPLQHKYKLTKLHLQEQYQRIEFQIMETKRFYKIYVNHSNRLKKVVIMQFLGFLHKQGVWMSESDLIKTNSAEGLWISHNEMGGREGLSREENEEEKQQNLYPPEQLQAENIYTGQFLTEDYTRVINRFLFAAYSEWKTSQFFKQTLTKELYILLNKQQNESISEVIVQNLQLAGYPPEISWIRQLHSEPFEFLADIFISFKGKLIIYLKTQYKLMGIAVPTEVKVEIEEIYCCIRLCFVPSGIGQSWFSFIGEPKAKFTVQPKIYTISINVETIRNFFSTLLLKKMKQSTFPTRQKIMIPVSKEDPTLQLIQKRFKSGFHF